MYILDSASIRSFSYLEEKVEMTMTIADRNARPRLIIAGTGSGAGKTTVTLGLMRALAQRGLSVQGFKCGPDYIDPTYHTAVTGRPSRNLDAWMTSPEYVRDTFEKASAGHDISIIEGVMGLYDGKDPLSNTGSTAEIALVTQTPVILVVDVRSMARSAAAIVLGFQHLEPELNIAGVIVNRCGSAGHYTIVKKPLSRCAAFRWLAGCSGTRTCPSLRDIWDWCLPLSAVNWSHYSNVQPMC